MNNLIKFIKFNIIGGLMTLLTFILFYACSEYLGISYIFSNIVSYIIPVIISFFLNEVYTFSVHSSRQETFRKILLYLFMKICVLLIDTIMLWLWVSILCIDKYWGKLINTILLTLISYSLTKKILTTN